MAIPENEKNKKLKASPAGQPMAALTALKKLKRSKEETWIISSVKGPPLPGGNLIKHLQGVAVLHGRSIKEKLTPKKDRSRMFLTTSGDGGKIITTEATPDGKNYIVDNEPIGYDHNLHPGGIQIIGHYLVIPIYFDNNSFTGIEFRDLNDKLRIVRNVITDRRPYCVGIATSKDKNGEFYVLAAVTKGDGSLVYVYRTPSGRRLTDPSCFFELCWKFRASPKTGNPNKDWNGYPNSISLISDKGGNVYFLGLYKGRQEPRVGKDHVDLYHMDISDTRIIKFKRLGSWKAETEHASFRWGGSASVVGDDAIEIYACAHNITKKTVIKTDIFV